MARTHSSANQQIPPKDRGNYKRAYTETIQRHKINQNETGGNQIDSVRTPRDPNKENK